MKNLKKTIIVLSILIAMIGCKKQETSIPTPVASFSTDKSSYIAGDTVHLRDSSTNALSWKWTVPNGQTFTTQNLDYNR